MQILYVEDNKALADMVQKRLERFHDVVLEVVVAASLADARRFLAVARPDVILLDLGLPDSKGVATYTSVQESAPEVPVVIISATDERDTVVEALRLGAHDYITKGKLDPFALAHILEHAIGKHAERMREEMARQESLRRLRAEAEAVERTIADDPSMAIELARQVARSLRSMTPEGEDSDA